MAVKTITIDMEAYSLLSEEKHGNESFSKVIKRTLKKNKKSADMFLLNLDKFILEDKTLNKIEDIVETRNESIISSPIPDMDE